MSTPNNSLAYYTAENKENVKTINPAQLYMTNINTTMNLGTNTHVIEKEERAADGLAKRTQMVK